MKKRNDTKLFHVFQSRAKKYKLVHVSGRISRVQKELYFGFFVYLRMLSCQIKEGHVEEVDGVVLNVDRNVLRTPAVIVDALLGQGEALDCFNAQGQEAKMQIEKLEAKKLDLALQALEAITDPVQRAEMYAKMFNPAPVVRETNPTV